MSKRRECDNNRTISRKLVLYCIDLFLFIISAVLSILIGCNLTQKDELLSLLFHFVLAYLVVLLSRIFLGVYRQIWRFTDIHSYVRLSEADALAGVIYYIISKAVCFLAPISDIDFSKKLSLISLNLVLTIIVRQLYQFCYQSVHKGSRLHRIIMPVAKLFLGLDKIVSSDESRHIKVAIVGAGNIGTSLAEELLIDKTSPYKPVMFFDDSDEKVGRVAVGLPVINPNEKLEDNILRFGVQVIIIAIQNITSERRKEIFEKYSSTGCVVKNYDRPLFSDEKAPRQLRNFSIEELLFRNPKEFINESVSSYYKDKVIMVTGGGGSIGSELCNQISKMSPKQLIVVDIAENGAYDIQQRLKPFPLIIEIASVCDRAQLEKIFVHYHPDVILHAAAHKHVPLMEDCCCEAIRNNVFGTLNVVQLAEKYNVSKFIMISTDKAVNPTNIMGATKRMCEMIVQSRHSSTLFSSTRFGNVLGSNGSVIPLFKKQIENGGPVTITDKRIIRYFMTIPEASQLVLESGALAKNGDLFVLDMGNPVKIIDLAENMIKLSGLKPYKDIDIKEIGLRPGEKLYEELLIDNSNLTKTQNDLIFVERDTPLSENEIDAKLKILKEAVDSCNEEKARAALHAVVPTYIEKN